MIFKNIKQLSASSQYELENCIEALYEMLPLDDDSNEVWFCNRLRHILENVLTDEAFDRLYSDKEYLVIYKRDGSCRVVEQKGK